MPIAVNKEIKTAIGQAVGIADAIGRDFSERDLLVLLLLETINMNESMRGNPSGVGAATLADRLSIVSETLGGVR